MFLRKCPFCQKDIPAAITECPYCHRDETGRDVTLSDNAVLDSQTQKDIAALASPDPLSRSQAGDRLVEKGPVVVTALVRLLNEHASKGVAEAAKVLGRIRDRRAAEALTQVLKSGDEEVRASAVWALHQVHDTQSLPELIHEAERKDGVIQSYLVYTLGGFQDPKVVPTLVKLVGNNNSEVAFQAVWALAELGDKTAVRPLRRFLSKKDPLMKAAAEAALRRLGGPVRKLSSVWSWVGWAVGFAAVSGLLWYAYK